VQTVADYPLVEAIRQNVVKHPVLPDAPSRAKLVERQSAKFIEKYVDYIDLGVVEWRKAFAEHEKMGKKAVLFVMTDDTRNCDDVADYLRATYPEFADEQSVLVIHTKNNGEISEAATGKAKEELEKLRGQANRIDRADSPCKAIVSVLMLKEGWDVKNVTTIVGLRAYAAKSNILPEQTLGRGLRRMYPGDVEEYVSVIGTEAFMAFVESIQTEGVELERKAMGEGTGAKTPLVVEVDRDNPKKDLEALDIEIPVLSPRMFREYKNLADLDPAGMTFGLVAYRQFSAEEQREIVFRDITDGQITHTTVLDGVGVADYRSVIAWFARTVMKELHLFSGFDVLYGKVKAFVRNRLFGREVDLESPNTLRNGSHQEGDRHLQTGGQRPDGARPGRRRNQGHHPAASDPALRGQGAGLPLAQKIGLQPPDRGQCSGAGFCRFSGRLPGCRLVCQKLPGRLLQARLHHRRRRHRQLLPGFFGQAERWPGGHCRNQGARGAGRAPKDDAAGPVVCGCEPGSETGGLRLRLRG
jgi:type III restriction enzyme